MSNTVQMQAPAGINNITVAASTPPTSGQTYLPDSNGLFLADPLDIPYLLKFGCSYAFAGTDSKVTTDDGTTKTLTVAQITGGRDVYLKSAGGTTPSLTLPLAADLAAAIAGMAVGASFKLRVINTNSGTLTIVTNTGWTLTGTLTVATNTWKDFIITKTAAATFTGVLVGSGVAP